MLSALQQTSRVALALAAVVVAGAATWKLACIDWHPDCRDRIRKSAEPADSTRWREILADRPLDGAAFRGLGDRAAAAGDKEAAAGFYLTAARRDPRDPLVRTRLIDLYLAGGDLEAAVLHLDALLRISPEAGNPLLRRILGWIGNETLQTALVRRLALDPPWRESLPAALATTSAPTHAQDLLALLGTQSSLRPAEVALWASLLEQMDRPADARNAWSAALPIELRPLDGLVFDGGFESAGGPEPYGWRLQSPVGAVVGVDTSQGAQGGSSLVLLFDGRAVDFSGVSQDLVLPAGRYQLEVLADLALAGSTRPFAWTVACRGTGAQIARLELPPRSPGWTGYSALFEVPSSCPRQRLALVHEGRNITERRLSGRMAFDAIELQELQL